MFYILNLIFSFTIAIAAVIGLVRLSKIDRTYYPFLILIWLGLVTEVMNLVMLQIPGHEKNNLIVGNIYVLGEAILITWQFKRWGLFRKLNWLFGTLIISYFFLWTAEKLKLYTLNDLTHLYSIWYGFLIVLMSISTLNSLIVRERKNILKNPIFLICIGFVVFFTTQVITEGFLLYGIRFGYEMGVRINYTKAYVNLFSNLIYAVAVLCMPSKHRFSMPS
jgi:hypothetical protein